MLLNEQRLDDIVVEKFRLDVPPADLWEWKGVVDAKANPEAEVRIAMVGKYIDLNDAYMSLNEALGTPASRRARTSNIDYVESKSIETKGTALPPGRRRDPRAGRLRPARLRRQDRGREVRAREEACRTSASATGCTRR